MHSPVRWWTMVFVSICWRFYSDTEVSNRECALQSEVRMRALNLASQTGQSAHINLERSTYRFWNSWFYQIWSSPIWWLASDTVVDWQEGPFEGTWNSLTVFRPPIIRRKGAMMENAAHYCDDGTSSQYLFSETVKTMRISKLCALCLIMKHRGTHGPRIQKN